MSGLRDLLASERGTFCIVLVLIATLMVFVGKLSAVEWISFAKWLGAALVASKTVSGVVEARSPTV